MKQPSDKFTADMFGKSRGRPSNPNALTVAERVRRHRARKKLAPISVTSNEKRIFHVAD